MVNSRFIKYLGLALIGFLLILAELFTRTGLIDPLFTPPPTEVFGTLYGLILRGDIVAHVGSTLMLAFVGYITAMLIAVPLGVAMGEFRLAFYLLEPIVEMLRPIPSAAVIPAAVVLIGIGNGMRITVIIFGALWPTIVSTVDSVRNVDAVLIETGRTLNFTRWQVIQYIIIPAASPGIATGMRISMAVALILTVTVEMIAGSIGLGYFILDKERSFRYPEMFAGLICIAVLGYAINKAFVLLESRLLAWHRGFLSKER